jgi:hypothetical protein
MNGMSRQGVYNYLKMKLLPEGTPIHQQQKPLIELYKDYLIKRCNEGCCKTRTLFIVRRAGLHRLEPTHSALFCPISQTERRQKIQASRPANEPPVKAPTVTHGINWPPRPLIAVFGNFINGLLGPPTNFTSALAPKTRQRASGEQRWVWLETIGDWSLSDNSSPELEVL